MAIYTYVRDGEHRELRNKDVDLVHKVLGVSRAWDRRAERVKATKTKRTRRISIEPALLPLLEAMRAQRGDAPDGFVDDLPSERDMARGLRRYLQRAGIDRPELYETTMTSKAITWHDLRATGATWLAVRGEQPLTIMQRCGHDDIATTMRYVRLAEALRARFGAPFPDLPKSLLGGNPSVPPPGRTTPNPSASTDGFGGNLVHGTRNAEDVTSSAFLTASYRCGADGTRIPPSRRVRVETRRKTRPARPSPPPSPRPDVEQVRVRTPADPS